MTNLTVESLSMAIVGTAGGGLFMYLGIRAIRQRRIRIQGGYVDGKEAVQVAVVLLIVGALGIVAVWRNLFL